MANETALLQFFEITHCGYYKRGANTPEFGSLIDTLNNLHSWAIASQATVDQTATCDSDEDDNLPVYCLSLHQHAPTGCALLVTWNETETLDGNYGAVIGTSPAGNASVVTRQVPAGGIPGFPTYFWIDPAVNILASIRFSKASSNGHQGLQRYIHGFLQTHGQCVVYGPQPENGGPRPLLGYRAIANNDPDDKIIPKFSSIIKSKAAPITMIRNNRNRIHKLYRKKLLRRDVQPESSLWNGILGLFGIQFDEDSGEEVLRFQSEIDYSPTLAELNALLAREQAEIDEKWSDIGVKLQNDQKIYWLSQIAIKHEMMVNVIRDGSGIIDAQTLFLQLVNRRNGIRRIASGA